MSLLKRSMRAKCRACAFRTYLAKRRAAECEELEPLDVTAEAADAHKLVILLLRQRDVFPLLFNQVQRYHLLRTELSKHTRLSCYTHVRCQWNVRMETMITSTYMYATIMIVYAVVNFYWPTCCSLTADSDCAVDDTDLFVEHPKQAWCEPSICFLCCDRHLESILHWWCVAVRHGAEVSTHTTTCIHSRNGNIKLLSFRS